ncbi:MAG: T9SS type A sorting domain-containing protein [Bacteroidales bacterium]|nr:T9SS type A sorting domain-containing protein [Bacteroidales bacterium]
MRKTIYIALTICLLAITFAVKAQTNPYITRVFDFSPAPGQFVHVHPNVALGADSASVARQVEQELAGKETGMVSLGAFGGYIVMGFDHDVINQPGVADFVALGNAFNTSYGTNGEPGIIMVADDINNNGLPDDPWYEIAGSAYTNCIKNYAITYYKPSDSLDNASGDIANYIAWIDNQGNSGYLAKNIYHSQSYYPCWYDSTKTFYGTFIPDSVMADATTGYCDVFPNNNAQAGINIDDAVDANGQPANLTKIRFVRVHTGVYKVVAPFGETSTEVCGAKDLHATVGLENTKVEDLVLISNDKQTVVFNAPEAGEGTVYGAAGNIVKQFHVDNGYNSLNIEQLAAGVYVLTVKNNKQNYRLKLIKR